MSIYDFYLVTLWGLKSNSYHSVIIVFGPCVILVYFDASSNQCTVPTPKAG